MPIKVPRAGAMNMSKYANDPREIKAKFASKCSKCKTEIPKGINCYYWPSSRQVFCLSCGDHDYRQFQSSACDEEVYAGTGNPYAY